MNAHTGILRAPAVGSDAVICVMRPSRPITAGAAPLRGRARTLRASSRIDDKEAKLDVHPLLASDLVDAVYVALPVSMHTPWTLRALEAGKHVLCEKPLATSPTDAARCFDAAEAAGRVVVEG